MLRRTRNRLLSIMIMNGVSVATLLPWRRGHRQRSHLHHFCVVSPLCERPPRQPRYPFSRHIRQTFLEMAEIGRALVFKWQNGMRREASHVSGRRLFVISLHNLCTCASMKKSSAPICAARCSGEAAAVLMRLTWALSKSFRVPRSCGSKKKSLSSCWRSGRPGSLGATSAAVAAPTSCPNLSAPALLVDPPPQLLSRGGREREGHLRRGDVNEQPAVRSVGGSAILSGARRPRGHTN